MTGRCGRVPLVEDQVDDLEHRRQPLRPLRTGRHLERDAGGSPGCSLIFSRPRTRMVSPRVVGLARERVVRHPRFSTRPRENF